MITTVFKVIVYNWVVLIKTMPLYLKYPRLLVADFMFFLYRLFIFTPCLLIKEKEAYTYGEVSYVALEKLRPFFDDDAVFVDLGSGLGKSLVYMSVVCGFSVIGVEVKRSMVFFSRLVMTLLFIKNGTVLCQNLKSSSLPKGTIYLITGTCFEASLLTKLSDELMAQHQSITVVSTSQPLKDILVVSVQELPTSWGKSKLYVQKLVH